ncbi:MAG: Fur family transcriptional regulator [Chloroflexota bacterium]|nr:Fur family transcriptional regulator [Chloroflexota bacterium]
MVTLNSNETIEYRCAADLLRQAGFRVTRQRAQLLALLVSDCQQGEHLDAESLHKRAHAGGLKISLATVYRTLALFKELGLVSQHHFVHDGTRDYYEAATRPTHHHFACLRCGQVLEFQTVDVQSLSQEVANELGVQIRHASLYVEGICPDCQRRDLSDSRQSRLARKGENGQVYRRS